jgi:hypothetical protein
LRLLKNREYPASPSGYNAPGISGAVQRPKGKSMATCEQCGNDYDKSFAVTMGGRTMIFDSFECAIQALAPTCLNCGNRIIGHGVEHNGSIFCCVHCAKQEGVTGLRDRD